MPGDATGPSSFRPWSLRALVEQFRTGELDPATALDRARRRIAETDATVRAWVRPTEAGPPVDGPLSGVPLGVKDIVDVAGVPTGCGSALRRDCGPAAADATVVTRWRATGAVPIGKTVTTEFAYFAPGPTRNPNDPDHTPGGSSSGSAAAVAAGQVPLALGTQTAGSTIRPASFCGIAGLVLGTDRVPFAGVSALSPSLDRHGVFAASVADLALAFAALCGEPDAAGEPGPPPRLLVWDARTTGAVEPSMADALDDASHRLARAGATLAPFPAAEALDELIAAHATVLAHEAARERAAEHRRRDLLSPQLLDLLDTGAALSEQAYAEARRRISVAGRTVAATSQSWDAVLAPAAPGPAPHGLGSTGDAVMSRAWQTLGWPAVAVPGLRDSATGLPLGLQLAGPPGTEARLLRLGCQVEEAIHGHR